MKGNNKPYVKCYFIYFKQLSENSAKGTTVIYVNILYVNWFKSYIYYSNHACSYHAGRNCYPIVAHVLLIVAAVYNKIACLIERVSILDTNRI